MKSRMRIVKAVVLASTIAFLCQVGLTSDRVADNAKIYQDNLEAMKGQKFQKIQAKLREWKFEYPDIWKVENPTPKDIAKHDWGKIEFSDLEIQDIFSSAGKFKVGVYKRLVGVATTSSAGSTTGKNSKANLELYTVIRVVFKEDKLINVRTWPRVAQPPVPGTYWIR